MAVTKCPTSCVRALCSLVLAERLFQLSGIWTRDLVCYEWLLVSSQLSNLIRLLFPRLFNTIPKCQLCTCAVGFLEGVLSTACRKKGCSLYNISANFSYDLLRLVG